MSVAEEQLRAMGASLAERDEALAALKAEKERLASACSAGMWQCGAQEQEILCVFECVFGGGGSIFVRVSRWPLLHPLAPHPPDFPVTCRRGSNNGAGTPRFSSSGLRAPRFSFLFPFLYGACRVIELPMINLNLNGILFRFAPTHHIITTIIIIIIITLPDFAGGGGVGKDRLDCESSRRASQPRQH